MPKSKFMLTTSLVLVVAAGMAYFFLERREPDPTTASSKGGEQLVEVAEIRSWNLEDLCAGRLMEEFAGPSEFSSAITGAIGKLGNGVFNEGLIGCAENIRDAGLNGAVPKGATTMALVALGETCTRLRGSEHACSTINLLRESAEAVDVVPIPAP